MTRKELIVQMAQQAGEAIASITPSQATVITKEGRGNYVTLADKTSESIIFTGIREHFSSDTVLSEETTSKLTEAELLKTSHLWIIDPIDGTANYQHQRKYSCISIAYAEKGILKLGVVYDPFRQELYLAERGNGAFHNGEPMKIGNKTTLHQSTIITDNSYTPETTRKHLETLLKIPQTPWIQMKGSAALEMCEVAGGQADMFYCMDLKPWDNAAAFLILEECGAILTNLEGEPINFFSPTVIAGNPTIVQEFLLVTS